MTGISKFYKPSHRQKTRFFHFLDLLPNSIGYYLYHKAQSLFKLKDIQYKISSTRNSFLIIKRILQSNNIDIKNSKCIEMGSGWLPIFPYLLKIEGEVNKVLTYDVHEYYNVAKVKNFNKAFEIYCSAEGLKYQGKYHLLEGVHYFAKTSVEKAPLDTIDFIFSRFVLEHIKPEIIEHIHDNFHHQISDDTYILHLISPSDHRAYNDKSISLYDFLKYSSDQWEKIQTKFDYHNRLRLPQYLKIFKKNFDIIYLEYNSCKKNTEEYFKYKSLKIHSEFKNFTDDEITAGSINVLLKKKRK